jgi:hypothetical protein
MHPIQDLFFRRFFICAIIWYAFLYALLFAQKFYSCKKWVLQNLLEGTKSPSPKAAEGTQKAKKPPSPATTQQTPGTNQRKTSRGNSPTLNPQKHGLRAAADAPTGEGLARPRVKEVPLPSPRVANSLAQDPDFIKVGCLIGKNIMATVNTETEHADIQPLQSDLDSASLRIKVSSLSFDFCFELVV